jgi:hypothetical protein
MKAWLQNLSLRALCCSLEDLSCIATWEVVGWGVEANGLKYWLEGGVRSFGI